MTLNPKEKVLKRLPVDIFEGEIIIEQFELNNSCIPEILMQARNSFAYIELENTSTKTIEVKINRPFLIQKFSDEKFEVYTMNEALANCQNYSGTEVNINQLIRTNHMNREEKKTILTYVPNTRRYS